MPLLDIVNRERLPQAVLDELDQHNAALVGYLYTEHDDEGSHTDVIADSLTIREGGTIELPGGNVLSEGSDEELVIDAPAGVRVTDGADDVLTIGITADVAGANAARETTSWIDLALRGRLALGPIIDAGTWSSSDPFGVGVTGSTSAFGVGRIVYRAQPAADRTISRIYYPSENGVTGATDGAMVVILNDSAFTITFDNPFALSPGAVLNGPIIVGPSGAALLVYDEDGDGGDGGWWVVAVVGEGPKQTYTPVLSSTGTPPTGYSAAGTYIRRNGWVHGHASVTLSGGFSAGTGVYTISLPTTAVTPANSVHAVGSALIFDASVSEFWHGTAQLIGGSVVTIVPDGSRARVGPTVPVTLASSDQLGVVFSYPEA